MVKRILALALVLAVLLPGCAGAAIDWKTDTPGQEILRGYIETVNVFLTEQGEREVNRLFELYPKFAELGITNTDSAEAPEGIEITVYLYHESMNSMQLRVNDAGRFPRIAAAFLRAMNPEGMTAAEALAGPTERAQKAYAAPTNSFEDEVDPLNGTAPRVYYAYFPDQYHDRINWMQMTIIFPLAEYWNGAEKIVSGETPTRGPDTYSGNDAEYDGYFSKDDYDHYEFFTTPTPEPDSAAAEFDEW